MYVSNTNNLSQIVQASRFLTKTCKEEKNSEASFKKHVQEAAGTRNKCGEKHFLRALATS